MNSANNANLKVSKEFVSDTRKQIKEMLMDPYKYWADLLGPNSVENVAYYCTELIEALANPNQQINDNYEGIYSTLLILEFYKNTKYKSEQLQKQYQDLFTKAKPLEHAVWVSYLYIKISLYTNFAYKFIYRLCHLHDKLSWQIEPGQEFEEAFAEARMQTNQIYMRKQYKMFKFLRFMSYDPPFVETKILSFAYCCFLDYLRSTNLHINQKTYTHIIEIIKGLAHAKRVTTQTDRILGLSMYFLQQLLTYYGCEYEYLLKYIMHWANIIQRFYGKNADIAEYLFTVAHYYLKIPGYNFRKELRKNFVALDIKRMAALSSPKYLITSQCDFFSSPYYCSLGNLRKLIILNLLGCIELYYFPKFEAIILRLDEYQTFMMYYKLMKIVDIAITLYTYSNIRKMIKESIIDLFKLDWNPINTPKVAAKKAAQDLQDIIIRYNARKYFYFPYFEIIRIDMGNLAKPKHQHSLQMLLYNSRSHPFNYILYRNQITLIHVGDDSYLGVLVDTISEVLIKLSPVDYQALSVYVVPVQNRICSLSEYLSRKDLWYRRFVGNLFGYQNLFPKVYLFEGLKDSFPAYLFAKSLQTYLREAYRRVPIRIYRCNLLKRNPVEEKNIYFFAHVFIGASVECEKLRRQANRDDRPKDYMDYYIYKTVFYPIIVSTQIRYKLPNIDQNIKADYKFLSVEDIKICNTPHQYFFGNRPNPLNDFLELSMLLTNSAKVFRNEIAKKDNFKRNSEKDLTEAFKDLFVHETIYSIMIYKGQVTADGPVLLTVMVDGTIHENVYRVRIEPAFTKGNHPLTLPVKCFLPFEE